MNRRQVFVERNGDHVHVGWACGECGRMYTPKGYKAFADPEQRARDEADDCCEMRPCEACGGERRYRYNLLCSTCKDAKRLARILDGELLTLEEVEGPFFDWDNDGFYQSIDQWIEDQAYRLSEYLDECPDARPDDVVSLGEPREWAPDVERWLEGEEEVYMDHCMDIDAVVLSDYREEIAAAQAIVDQIRPVEIWESSGRYVDVRPLHDEVMRLAREWAE